MKIALPHPFRAALALTFLAAVTASSLAGSAPAISVKDVVALAEEALAAKNPGPNVFIDSVILQKTSILTGKQVWSVTWSEVIPGSKPGSQEVGLEISMDGSVVHLIKGRGTSKPQALPH